MEGRTCQDERLLSKDVSFVRNWLTKSIFAYTENSYFRLDWWEGLSTETQESIYAFAMTENYTKVFDFDELVSKDVRGQILQIHNI